MPSLRRTPGHERGKRRTSHYVRGSKINTVEATVDAPFQADDQWGLFGCLRRRVYIALLKHQNVHLMKVPSRSGKSIIASGALRFKYLRPVKPITSKPTVPARTLGIVEKIHVATKCCVCSSRLLY
jgi:hypothetical protein